MRLVWSVPAQTDLESIYAFIAQDNPHAAALVVRRIRDRVRQHVVRRRGVRPALRDQFVLSHQTSGIPDQV